MLYFKFTDKNSAPMYASVKVNNVKTLTPEQKQEFFERIARLLNFENLEEVSKEEFDSRSA